jgi:dienelactone hydrolase
VKAALLLLMTFATAGCCAMGMHHTPVPPIPADEVAKQFSFEYQKRPVYVFGESSGKPPLLLLHELPGFTPQAWNLAKQLSSDFTVYVPLLFGRAGVTYGKVMFTRIVLSPAWRVKRRHATAPIEDSLLALVDEIHRRQPTKPVGVIGMCLTGNLAVPILGRRSFVRAAVVSQPSLPFCDKDDIALSAADIDAANVHDIPFLFLRFSDDGVSHGKLVPFNRLMPRLVRPIVLPDHHELGDSHFRHAVLTSELFDASGAMIDKNVPCEVDVSGNLVETSKTPHCVYGKVVEYLRGQLRADISK